MIFAGVIFLVAAFFAGIFPVSFTDVSRETVFVKQLRETALVKSGVSQNGALSVGNALGVPNVAPSAKSLNHERTLRAFIASNAGGVATLYVESVKPHIYYVLTGTFAVSPEYDALLWQGETTLVFYGTSLGGEAMRYVVDLSLLTLSSTTVAMALSASPAHIQSSSALP